MGLIDTAAFDRSRWCGGRYRVGALKDFSLSTEWL